ncbi:translation elongation factor Ts [Buchnera aphidicola]|uniref:Elongation factor Ts n=1 Tax=Buchnera aphidicola subsp. Cinara cedri (strain Cc) TaxID=372461 RepID=EFTS_BUCCC|nr:translation elongation factor Ts [Buchnera aphidicola]Q057T0.1 RecName: Full=Elongation factor Ts; Short=EF-Ts [Buchnera aphidicola BCc]ABJ90619.1 elongation factor Ts [Buchnera aphidicola BCc]
MKISVKLIKELRIKTGSGYLECKRALQKSNGNIINAINYLRIVGTDIAQRKVLRKTKFGRIFSYCSKNLGVLLELTSETDFVSKNEEFKNFGEKIVNFSGNNKIFDLTEINEIFNSKKINFISRVRENIEINKIKYITGNIIESYQHLGKIGVIISGKMLSPNTHLNTTKCFKNIAMHVAAAAPLYLSELDIPNNVLQKETDIQKSIAKKTGKSSKILQAIIKGRLKKFISEITLINQNFIINPKITIHDYLKENQVWINNFIRLQVGENIDNLNT